MDWWRRWRRRRVELAAWEQYHWRLVQDMEDLRRWCAEDPIVVAVVEWLRVNDARYRSAPYPLPHIANWPSSIAEFREHLRRMRRTGEL